MVDWLSNHMFGGGEGGGQNTLHSTVINTDVNNPGKMCKAGLTLCDFFKSPLGLYLSDVRKHDDHVTLLGSQLSLMSDCTTSRRVKNRACKKTLSGVLHYQPHTRPVTTNCIAHGTELFAIMKSIWTAAIPAYLRRIVYAALHTQMKTVAQPVLFI